MSDDGWDVRIPGWLLTFEGGRRGVTHWHFGPNQRGRITWEELAEKYPDRVVSWNLWKQICRRPSQVQPELN